MIRAPLPVTVVTGFLGAGKTTLLSNLLHETKGRRLAIVVNEFGEVSIDGALLRDHQRGTEVQVQDVANGLLAYGDDALFMPLMAQLHARRDLIDHVVIETSGLAVPTAVMERLQSDALLAERFVLDATLAVVDTPLLLTGQFDPVGVENAESHASTTLSATAATAASVAELFRLQINHADVVVLNKIDDLDKRALIEAETRIRRLAPNVRFIELAHRARLDTRLALGLRLHQPGEGRHSHARGATSSQVYTQVASLQASPVLSRRLDGHSHSGLAPHTHGLLSHKHFHEHDPGWQSFVLHSHAPQTEATLLAALAKTAQAEPVMRIKGFVHTAGDGRPVLIQGVRSRIGAIRSAAVVHEHDDAQAHDHAHRGDGAHSHEHEHEHGHGHDHRHDDSHSHSQDHGHEHSHSHSHDHGHEHGHSHSHDHRHEHSHSHSHDHGHEHSHDHDHDADDDQHRLAHTDVSSSAGAVAHAESQLVFIGYHASRKRVAELVSELTGTLWH
ncbi:CobW family GTP-binding protein [Pararobbsia alpina]|uniref:CobW C-terminal domain-containing protein n=1 Tax=Pararobbsia alpina TaxID=621374 RepID=A0A6S7BAK6_9BURK|nr:GTP-binding protein [Pararobbsia alpina]CAB3792799.1 hypothetical protein LMG28138_03421 [Pararobbsia alpina]